MPKYDFNWQHEYVFNEPLKLPAGTKLHAMAWYDNSTANKSNPDPTKDVTWGDQTWEEMMYTGITFSMTPPPTTSAQQQERRFQGSRGIVLRAGSTGFQDSVGFEPSDQCRTLSTSGTRTSVPGTIGTSGAR